MPRLLHSICLVAAAGCVLPNARADSPGMAVLGCNIHVAVATWAVVKAPHHRLTGADRQRSLPGVAQ